MAAPAEAEATVAVALLGCADAARDQLRQALLACGAQLVFEADPRETDLDSLERSHPAVVIVNLDSATEDAVDALQPVLDDPAINVVFNDSDVTRQLEGWDLARWARHLAAKVLGHAEVNPPAPSNAEPLPMRDMQPRPGAPPTPAEMAGEHAIEEFESEAEEVADSVPIDYMPMAETPQGQRIASGQDESLDVDLSGLQDALDEAGQVTEVSPRAVPGAPEGDEDAEAALPPLDLGALDAALQADAKELEQAASAAPRDAPQPPPAQALPPEDQAVPDAALEQFDLDSDEPADFSRSGERDSELELDADLEALSRSIDRELEQAGDADSDPVVDVQFQDEGPAAAREQPDADAAPAAAAPAARGADLDFSSLELMPIDGDEEPGTSPAAAGADFDFGSLNLSLEPAEGEAGQATGAEAGSIGRVIVLGASIGGPDALRGFLAGIPEGFPAVFLLAQHLDNGFFERLAAQLQKAARMPVRVPEDAHRARQGEVLVIPGDENVELAADGSVTRAACAEPPRYRPCIDDVLRMVADRFGANATAIIFSGMAGDAVEGSVYLASKGGEVWAQTPDSCVVSSMVDGASSRGVVEFMGTPRELADYCVQRFGNAG